MKLTDTPIGRHINFRCLHVAIDTLPPSYVASFPWRVRSAEFQHQQHAGSRQCRVLSVALLCGLGVRRGACGREEGVAAQNLYDYPRTKKRTLFAYNGERITAGTASRPVRPEHVPSVVGAW